MESVLDTVFSRFDPDAARTELEKRRREVLALEETLAAYDHWRGRQNGQKGGGLRAVLREHREEAAQQRTQAGDRAQIPGGRAAVLALIKRHPGSVEWTTPKVRKAMDLSADADPAIQKALARLATDNELVRQQAGVYTLPPASRDPGEERGGGLGTPPAMGAGET